MFSLRLLLQELRAKRKLMVIWSIIWSLLLAFFAGVFNSFSKDAAESAKLFEQMPKGFFDALNINPSLYLTQIEQFISGQFLFVYLLAGCIFAFSLGVGAIGKRIDNRTIALLLTTPISRSKMYITQCLTNLLFFVVTGIILCSMSLLIMHNLLSHQDIVSTSYFINLFAGSSLLFAAFSALGQLVGMLTNGEHAVQAGAGIVVVSWFTTSLSGLVAIPQTLQHLSLFYYFDTTLLRDTFRLSVSGTITLACLLLVFALAGTIIFRKKDIYL